MKNCLIRLPIMILVLFFSCNVYVDAQQIESFHDDYYKKNCKYIGQYDGEDWYIHLGNRSVTDYEPNKDGGFDITAEMYVFRDNKMYLSHIINAATLQLSKPDESMRPGHKRNKYGILAVMFYHFGSKSKNEGKYVDLDLSDPSTVEFIKKAAKLAIEYEQKG